MRAGVLSYLRLDLPIICAVIWFHRLHPRFNVCAAVPDAQREARRRMSSLFRMFIVESEPV
jgi:hypothetical protein